MTTEFDYERAFACALRIHLVESQIAARYHEGQMRCPVHLSIGQEISSAVFEQVKEDGDVAVGTHRSHAHYLAMGGSLKKMIAELYGKATGCSKGRGGSMHLISKESGFLGSSAIVGNSISIGVGLGYGKQLDNQEKVSYVFMGDGAVEEGTFFESANFAVVNQLPVMFIVENNGYSVYTDLSPRQPSGRNISDLATAIGVQSSRVSDSDYSNVYGEMTRLSSWSRRGLGPSLIEVATYRKLEHCGPNDDDHLGYRPSAEIRQFKEVDLIERLGNKAKVSIHARSEMAAGYLLEIEEAFRFAEESPFPSYEEILENSYAE